MCRKQPGIAIGRLCDKCDGKCPVCDSYVRPTTLVRICDECSFGNYQNKCVVCGGEVSYNASLLIVRAITKVLLGNLRCVLLLRMYAVGEGSRRVPEDHQPRILENRLVLPKEKLSESLAPSAVRCFVLQRASAVALDQTEQISPWLVCDHFKIFTCLVQF